MADRVKNTCKAVLSLDEFDAVCDEFLKAFELIDQQCMGVIDSAGFAAYKRLLSGNNVTQIHPKFSASAVSTSASYLLQRDSKSVDLAHRSTSKAQLSAVHKPDHLSLPAFFLFSQKKVILLSMSFEQIDLENQGVIEAVQLLEVVGLASAARYMRSIFPAETKITDALWPSCSYIVDERESVDLETSRNDTNFEHHLFDTLSDFLPNNATLIECIDLVGAR